MKAYVIFLLINWMKLTMNVFYKYEHKKSEFFLL